MMPVFKGTTIPLVVPFIINPLECNHAPKGFKDFYIFTRRIFTAVSTFPVDGNISIAAARSTLYPLSCSTTRSHTRLVGLQEM